MIARAREWAIRLALVAASLAAFVGLLELWLASRDLPRDAGTLLVPHPVSPRLVRLAPDTTARFTGVSVRANRYGYRGPEWPIERPPGAFRIAFLGDSQTFGYAVDENDTYPAQLERRLRAAHPDTAWEALNFAMVGFNTSQEAEACSLDVRPFAPDLVLLGFFMNDVDTPVRPVDVAPAEAPADAGGAAGRARRGGIASAARSLRATQFLRTRAAALARRAGLARGTATARYRELFVSRSPAWRACEAGIRAIRDESAARGARFAVVILPFIVSLDATYPMAEAHRQVSELCAAEGIACLDLLPAFLGKPADRLCVTPINNHMNAEGNQIAADALFEWLARGDLLLLRPAGGTGKSP